MQRLSPPPRTTPFRGGPRRGPDFLATHWILAFAGMALALVFACMAYAQDAVPVPKLVARVTDQTGSLTADERARLDEKLRAFEAERGSQVAVLLVPSIGTETIEEFAGRVADAWQLGRKGVDDGVLLVVAKQERKLRVHTGRGVQGTLTDALSKRIVADIVAPRFRNGDFAGGIDAGVDAIMKAIAGEELPLPARKPVQPKVESMSSLGNVLIFAAFLVPAIGAVLRSMFGRFFGATATSGITAVAAWMLLGSLAIAIGIAVVAFLFTIASGTGITRGARRGGGWGGGYVPGGGWGGGGGGSWGGGGGGFSGGGGGFDGGGASGSW